MFKANIGKLVLSYVAFVAVLSNNVGILICRRIRGNDHRLVCDPITPVPHEQSAKKLFLFARYFEITSIYISLRLRVDRFAAFAMKLKFIFFPGYIDSLVIMLKYG